MVEHKNIEESSIREKYHEYIMVHGKRPENVYQFMTQNGWDEQDFYPYFGDFSGIEKSTYKQFFEETKKLLLDSTDFPLLEDREKLLTFYFTFFELLSLNRTLIKTLLKINPSGIIIIKDSFINWAENLHLNPISFGKHLPKIAQEVQSKIAKESLWKHFQSVLSFWLKDDSASFQQTDIYIEKSLDTAFSFIDTKPFSKLLDLGKFLVREVKQNETFR